MGQNDPISLVFGFIFLTLAYINPGFPLNKHRNISASIYIIRVLLTFIWFASTGMVIKPESASHTLTITVSNIRNTKGSIQFQVYRDQANFAAENPYKTFRVSKSSVENRKLTFEISGLPTDWYGIALLDDENNDKKMDYGLIMPTEGFGFSDYYHTAWSRPVFNQFKFELKSNKTVSIKIRYV